LIRTILDAIIWPVFRRRVSRKEYLSATSDVAFWRGDVQFPSLEGKAQFQYPRSMLEISNMSSKQGLRAAILVISTTASRDPSTDVSGKLLKDVFDKDGGGQWEVVDVHIIGDLVLDIQRTIMHWTDQENPVNLIVSTGGTGFATCDITPEACLTMGPFPGHADLEHRLYHP
jgi:Probable molybdopterin binding domain